MDTLGSTTGATGSGYPGNANVGSSGPSFPKYTTPNSGPSWMTGNGQTGSTLPNTQEENADNVNGGQAVPVGTTPPAEDGIPEEDIHKHKRAQYLTAAKAAAGTILFGAMVGLATYGGLQIGSSDTSATTVAPFLFHNIRNTEDQAVETTPVATTSTTTTTTTTTAPPTTTLPAAQCLTATSDVSLPIRYFIAFPKHFPDCPIYDVFITIQEDTLLTITEAYPFTSSRSISAAPGQIEWIRKEKDYTTDEGQETKSILVESTGDISIHVEAPCTRTAYSIYSYNVLPLTELGVSYVGLVHHPEEYEYPYTLVIIATEDATSVTVTSSTLQHNGDKEDLTFDLDDQNTYTITSTAKFATFQVTSNKRVAVLTGYRFYYFQDNGHEDASVYQLAPVSTGVTEYVFPPMAGVNDYIHMRNHYAILSPEADNTIYIYEGARQTQKMLGAMETYTITDSYVPMYILCTKPCFIETMVYSKSNYYDPESIQLRPICNMMTGTFYFTMPESDENGDTSIWGWMYAKIVIVASSTNSVALDQQQVTFEWNLFPHSGKTTLFYGEGFIDFGTHLLYCTLPCTAYLYAGAYHVGIFRQIPLTLSEVIDI